MRRKWHIGLLEELCRRRAKREKVRRCKELDRPKNPPSANQTRDESQEARRVFPPGVRRELTGPSVSEQKASAGSAGSGHQLCVVCAEPSETMICGSCADKIGADALEKKRWEERGKP
jgi:hypothetical protein